MKAENPKDVVNEQAEDGALWAVYAMGEQPIGEAMLQAALRRLHAAIEGEPWKGQTGKYLEECAHEYAACGLGSVCNKCGERDY